MSFSKDNIDHKLAEERSKLQSPGGGNKTNSTNPSPATNLSHSSNPTPQMSPFALPSQAGYRAIDLDGIEINPPSLLFSRNTKFSYKFYDDLNVQSNIPFGFTHNDLSSLKIELSAKHIAKK